MIQNWVKNERNFVLYKVRDVLDYMIQKYYVQDFFLVHIALTVSMVHDVQKIL